VEDELAADAAVNKAGDDSAHFVEANRDQHKSEESIEACSVSTVPSLVEAVSSEVLISVYNSFPFDGKLMKFFGLNGV
jgi:hypothetical protein